MSNIPPPNPVPTPPPGWYFHQETGSKKWWTGSQWLETRPKSAKTVPLATFITVTVVALVAGIVVGSESSSSALSAAKEKISQLEAQPTANSLQSASAEPPAAPAAAAPATATNPAAAAAVTLAGDGEMNSKKVALEGDYAVSWKTLGDCYYSASLKGGDTLIGPNAFTADAVTSGTGNIYDLKATDYYLDVITGPAPTCGWSVTLTPVP